MLASPPAANNYTSSQLAPTLDHGTKGVLLAAKSFLPNSPQIKGICFNGWHMALKQMRDRLNCQVKKPVLLNFADLGSVLTVFFACRPDQAQDGDVIDNAIQCDLDRQPATDSGGKKKRDQKPGKQPLSPIDLQWLGLFHRSRKGTNQIGLPKAFRREITDPVANRVIPSVRNWGNIKVKEFT